HLPFATDTLIADALATRLAARLGDAVVLPALPLGVAREHLGFPGTLALDDGTLEAIVRDVLRSLARPGIVEAIVFSAHGRNAPTGTVGDPSGATALHGTRYLEAWVDELERAWLRAKKSA